jgi:hypothetical protein
MPNTNDELLLRRMGQNPYPHTPLYTKPYISNEKYEKMLEYQRWYYATMPAEQRAKYLLRKKNYIRKRRGSVYEKTI